jgi:Kdo2-lipid IVA lauroyltransferase/acyltransferase
MMLKLARVLIRLLGCLPLRLLHALAIPLGWMLRVIPWKKHRVINTNLSLCFPHLTTAERARLHRLHLIELIRLTLEAGAMWQWSRERLGQHVLIGPSWDCVTAASENGKGLLFVGGHLGNWEILNLCLSMHLPMVTLYRAPQNKALDEFITWPRERFGGHMVASGSPALRHLLAQLRAGKAAGIAADIQPKRGDGVFVDLFGTPALTMTLVNRLARKTGCAVIFTWAERLPGGRGWQLHFSPADERIADSDPVIALQPMNRWLEQAIEQAPAQYLWIYKRFSRRPDGQKGIYRKGFRHPPVD